MKDTATHKLKQLFPEAFQNGKLDLEALKNYLNQNSEFTNEKYQFTWAGKQEALQILQIPSRATLKPVPKESMFRSESNSRLFSTAPGPL